MKSTLSMAWPLFVGLALIMLAHGLQGTLLGLRADSEGFGTRTIGLIMSCYYLGYLIGSRIAPGLVRKVGHIRVFAAVASMASATILFHAVFSVAWLWALVRIIAGFCFAGLFIVVESWLNAISTQDNRGKLLAFYSFTLYGFTGLGQFLLNLAPPEDFALFVLTSVLISFALVPIALSKRQAPPLPEPQRVSLKRLYAMSPLGLFGAFIAGMIASTMLSIGPVYASNIGLELAAISQFMAFMILGAMLFQFPMGWLSDRIDRRKIIILCAMLGALMAIVCIGMQSLPVTALLIAATFFSGLSMPIHALAIAHTNDHLEIEEIMDASASLILVGGLGAAVGPTIVTTLMDIFGPEGFFIFQALILTGLAGFGIYRTYSRPGVREDDKGHYMAIPSRTTPTIASMAEEGWIDHEDDGAQPDDDKPA
jgi:MFS family permease